MSIKVYTDQGVDRKKLVKLANNFNLEVVHVDHYEQSLKHAEPISGVFVLGQSMLDGGDYLGGEDVREVEAIIGQNGQKHSLDIAHIYSAYHGGCRYFVTANPKDFIRNVRHDPASNGRRESLEALLRGMKIVTLEELKAEFKA